MSLSSKKRAAPSNWASLKAKLGATSPAFTAASSSSSSSTHGRLEMRDSHQEADTSNLNKRRKRIQEDLDSSTTSTSGKTDKRRKTEINDTIAKM